MRVLRCLRGRALLSLCLLAGLTAVDAQDIGTTTELSVSASSLPTATLTGTEQITATLPVSSSLSSVSVEGNFTASPPSHVPTLQSSHTHTLTHTHSVSPSATASPNATLFNGMSLWAPGPGQTHKGIVTDRTQLLYPKVSFPSPRKSARDGRLLALSSSAPASFMP